MNRAPVLIGDTKFVKSMTLIGGGVTAVGIALSLASAFADYERFLFGYLIAFIFFAGIAATGVFFSMLQFLVRAGWSVSIRRIPELFGGFTLLLPVLVLPIVLGLGVLYHHWVHPEPGDVVLQGKAAWLNVPFFTARLFVYIGVWIAMYFIIVRNSFRQDHTTDINLTRWNWRLSAPLTIFYGVTITFAAFDLLMSLYPHWFSTIFGVYYFAGSLVGALAVITIIAVLLKKAGLMAEWLTSDRLHDLGKFLFAFNVFWAYIAFSQYMLIWYADLPEEVIFFTYRTHHGWEFVSILLLVFHFIVPFGVLLSQDAKRNPNVLLTGAVLLLAAHLLDVYWLVMPYYNHEAVVLGWNELGSLLALGGVFILVTFLQLRKRSAVPVNDPYLPESG